VPYRQNFPIPAVIDPPKMCLQLQIPDHPEWKAVISGLLLQPAYWFNWERTGDTSGAQCAAVWKEVYNSIDWSNMSCGCCDDIPHRYRVNPTTGNLEQSINGGVSWSAAAGGLQDLIVEPVPPVTSGVAATKCDAATNVAGQVDQWIAQVATDFDTAASILEFATAVLVAIAAAVFAALSLGALTAAEALVIPTIMAACVAAFGAGKVAFEAYWTTDVKDKILCAAFCNIGDDGSFTEAQFTAFWNDINADLPVGPAKMLFVGFLSSVGKEGLNAMAASGMSADADCEDCACEPGCVTEWHISEPNPGDVLGVITAQDDTHIEASTTNPQGGSGFYIYMDSGSMDNCCYVDYTLVESSSSVSASWQLCGSTEIQSGIISPGKCAWTLIFNSAAPFSINITKDNCP